MIETVERKGEKRISKRTGKPYRYYYHKKAPTAHRNPIRVLLDKFYRIIKRGA